jgi:hypothetical protein
MNSSMSDLFDILESGEPAFKHEKSTSSYNKDRNQPKKESLWDKTNIVPVKIDVTTFNKTGKTFSIVLPNQNTKIPDSVLEKMKELSKVLSQRGYTYRHLGAYDDVVQNEITSVAGIKVESYRPWKKFNPNIIPANPELTEKSYGIAVNSHRAFATLPSPVRAILATNVQLLLGRDCNNPLDLLITYSECGSEALGKNVDYKILKNLTFMYKVCEDSNIPVFNLKNDDAIQRIATYTKPQ